MYHRQDEKGLNWEPGGVRSGVPQVRSESGVFPIVRDLVGGALPAVAVVRRSSSAPVRRSEPNTSVHSSKGRLVGTRMEPRS